MSMDHSQPGGCPLCGAFHSGKYRSWGYCTYLRCRSCGLIFIDPIPDDRQLESIYRGEQADDIAPSVDPTGEEALYFDRFTTELDRIEKHVRRGRVLDIGCAWGFFLAVCKARGWHASGVDLSVVETDYARLRFGLDIFRGRLREAHFPEKQFDLVTLWHVLEHVRDPLAELREIRRIIKNDGLLVISVPTIRAAGTDDGSPDPLHLFYFDEGSLSLVLEKSGFRVIERRGQVSTGAVTLLSKTGIPGSRSILVRYFRLLSPLRRWAKRVLGAMVPPDEITFYVVPVDPGDKA
jgi:SAM-dependent methyltransferase